MAFNPKNFIPEPCDHYCCNKRHRWRNQDEADRCCNGWWPVWIPAQFMDCPEEWAKRDPQSVPRKGTAWVCVLIPETKPELYSQLVARCPEADLKNGEVQVSAVTTN